MTLHLFNSKFRRGLAVTLLCAACVTHLRADTVTIAGTINQSTQDGTGPAVNNPSLNNIPDGASYTVNLSFAGSITSPGTYNLSGLSLSFSVASAGAVESNFNSASVAVAPSGAFDQISILGCLTTGSACNQGNELDLNFLVLSADLNSQNVAAQGISGLLPLGLLEDDGVTDIHGLVTNYSYASASPVPEPAGTAFATTGLMAVGLICVRWRSRKRPN